MAEVWRDQRQWSHAAGALKRSIGLWRSTALLLGVLGAVGTTLAAQVGLDTTVGLVLSLVAAAVLAAVPVIRSTKLGRDRVEAWNRARSASEGLKAETFLFLLSTPPYDGPDAAAQLSQRTNAIIEDVDDLAGHTVGKPDADKPVPTVTDIESYLAVRVRPQLDDYYRPKAAQQQRRLTAFRTLEFGLGVASALLGAIAAATRADSVAVWVAVITTIAAAITAHIAAARYEHLVISYLSTARQLRFLIRTWRDATDHSPTAAATFVRECEDVVSRENESWMAAWSRDEE